MSGSKNKKEAVVLKYAEQTDYAPKVVAKGKGLVAEQILQKAYENHIPIQEDPTLLELLSELSIDQSIPEELYQAVAEVFAFIYKIDQELKNKN
ncbi:EscU/YscU/HrcU family type III secretion system export apparatus switch protein [Bacillaceae bacterium S4-13-58]